MNRRAVPLGQQEGDFEGFVPTAKGSLLKALCRQQ
jgi:hypothetical protein